MLDFILNSNGDITFLETDIENSTFVLDFLISKNESMLFDFYIENRKTVSYLKDLEPNFILNFSIKSLEYNKDIQCITDERKYIMQQIKIRLSSSLDTILKNETIGSDLERYKHENIDSVIDAVKQSIKVAIYDILPNATINISKSNIGYFDYTDSLIVTIINGNDKYYYYL